MDTSSPAAFVWYLLLFILDIIIYYLWMGINQMKFIVASHDESCSLCSTVHANERTQESSAAIATNDSGKCENNDEESGNNN
jgi:hypothetical protein